MPLVAQGEFALVREQLERALHMSGQPVRRGTIAHDHDVYMGLTDIAVRLRDENAIRTYAPVLDELSKRDGHRVFEAIAQRALGVAHRLAGEYAAAAESFDRALALFEAANISDQRTYHAEGKDLQMDASSLIEHTSDNESGVQIGARENRNRVSAHPWQVARTYVEIAELANTLADVDRARDYYRRALMAFEALGATPDMRNIRTAMEKLGL